MFVELNYLKHLIYDRHHQLLEECIARSTSVNLSNTTIPSGKEVASKKHSSTFERCLRLAQEIAPLLSNNDYKRRSELLQRVHAAAKLITGNIPSFKSEITPSDFLALEQAIEVVTELAMREPLPSEERAKIKRIVSGLDAAGDIDAQFREKAIGYGRILLIALLWY